MYNSVLQRASFQKFSDVHCDFPISVCEKAYTVSFPPQIPLKPQGLWCQIVHVERLLELQPESVRDS